MPYRVSFTNGLLKSNVLSMESHPFEDFLRFLTLGVKPCSPSSQWQRALDMFQKQPLEVCCRFNLTVVLLKKRWRE